MFAIYTFATTTFAKDMFIEKTQSIETDFMSKRYQTVKQIQVL